MLQSEKIMKKKHKDRKYFKKPKSTQNIIPIDAAYEDGMFLSNGKLYSKTYKLSDINYKNSGKQNQERIIKEMRDTVKLCPVGEISQFTIVNRRITNDTLDSLCYPYSETCPDELVDDLNSIVRAQSGRGNGIVQELYFTSSSAEPTPKNATLHFANMESKLGGQFGALGSGFTPLSLSERLRLLRDFYRPGDENHWHFEFEDIRRKGHGVKDSIAPMSIKFNSDHFEMDGKVGRVLAVTNYPHNITDICLSEITALDIDMMLSVSFMPVPQEQAINFIRRRISDLSHNSNDRKSKQLDQLKYITEETEEMKELKKDINALYHDVTSRDCAWAVATITVCHLADDLEQLKADTKSICDSAIEHGCTFKICREQQMDALNTVLPFALDRISIDRSITSESLASFMIFNAQEICEKDGVFYGTNAITRNPVVVNRLNHASGNAFITGVTGFGKSMFTKNEIISLRARYPNADFLILDPEGEYANTTKALGGEVYNIGKDGLNLFDMEFDPEIDDSEQLAYKSEFITNCCEQILGGALDAQGKSIVDRAVRTAYRPFIRAKGKTDPPLLTDFRGILQKMKDPRADEIALGLERFTDGTLKVFAKPTEIDSKSSLITFSLGTLKGTTMSLGMLITLDHILNRVMANKRNGRITFVYVEECGALFKVEQIASFFDNLWARIRKYDGFCIGITQNVEQILASKMGRAMLSNSQLVVMLNQSSTNAAEFAELFTMSPSQMQYFTNVRPGHGMIKVGSTLVPFVSNIPKDTKLYSIIHTDKTAKPV